MASQRQIQDKGESTQNDSIENGAAQQEIADGTKASKKAESASKSAPDDAQGSEQIDSLSQSLQGDLSTLDPDTALESIEAFQSLLKQSKQPEAKEIASGLKELQKLLKRPEPSGHELGELIGHLGEQTIEIAADTDKALKTPLQHLGKQLTKIGRSLAKAEDSEQLEDLDSLVDTLKQSPDKIDAKASVGDIDRWYDLLHKSEDSSLKEIATDLKALKQILKGSKAKGSELSEKLIELGEKTTASAAQAGRGFKGAIQKLGKALTTFGKSLG
jgi:translation initiation factor 2B subunit (eIF-2B alpha/beta/delta family)